MELSKITRKPAEPLSAVTFSGGSAVSALNPDSSFNWIVPGKIAVGNVIAAQDLALLKQEGFKGIFSLTDTLIRTRPSELGVEKIVVRPLLDGPGNSSALFRSIVQDLQTLVREHPPVLLHCHAGVSRSATVAAAYLMRTEGYFPEVALKKVKAARPQVKLSHGLRELLATLR